MPPLGPSFQPLLIAAALLLPQWSAAQSHILFGKGRVTSWSSAIHQIEPTSERRESMHVERQARVKYLSLLVSPPLLVRLDLRAPLFPLPSWASPAPLPPPQAGVAAIGLVELG